MIKIQTSLPYDTYSSKKHVGFASFPNNVTAARQKIRTKILDLNFKDVRKDCNDQYVYLYEIIKLNVKKKNTKKNQTSPQGNKVNKREIVNEGSVTVKLFRFRRENVASSKQHNRHFEVTLKF
jgi:hypothetical protein